MPYFQVKLPMIIRGAFTGAVLLSCVVMPMHHGWAQSTRDITSRIDRMENEIDTLSRALFRGEKPSAEFSSSNTGGADVARANLEVKISQFESELRNLRGQLEERDFEIRNLRQALETFQNDVSLRLGDLEGGGNLAATSGGAGAPSSVGAEPAVDPMVVGASRAAGAGAVTPADNSVASLGRYNQSGNKPEAAVSLYDRAFSLVQDGKYDDAEDAFSSFLQQYPSHSYASNAKYWLGETYYVRGDYADAVKVFAEGYQQYPNSTKSGDNLLKLGMSLAALDKKGDACVALQQLEKDDVKATASIKNRAKREKGKLGC